MLEAYPRRLKPSQSGIVPSPRIDFRDYGGNMDASMAHPGITVLHASRDVCLELWTPYNCHATVVI
jgi:hypothetical protein